MARTPRKFQEGPSACYHVMNRGHNREAVFGDADDSRYFFGLLARYQKRFPLRLFHYCLMSNHFHLLVQMPSARALSACMAGLLRAYVHYFNRRHGFVGHLWQGRFKSPAVDVEPYFLSCARYIERNPVTAGVTATPWGYEWSSCRAYALGVADGLLDYNVWYQELAGEPARRQQRWREFLLGDDPKEEMVRRHDWIVGEESYRRRMQVPQARAVRRWRGRPRKPPVGAEGFFPQFYESMEDV
jgi:putative transposase